MKQKKTFDPDDSIKEMSIFIMRRKAGFAAVTVRINVEAYLKPNERIHRGRCVQIAVHLASRNPRDIAAAFEEAARQLHAVTRKTPRLNRLGTRAKRVGNV